MPHRPILLLEDEPGIRMALGDAIHQAGMRVALLASHDEFLRFLASGEEARALITDINIGPGPNGVAAAIAARAAFPGLPVLYMTGLPGQAMPEASVAHILQKPFGPGQLLDRLRLVLGTEP